MVYRRLSGWDTLVRVPEDGMCHACDVHPAQANRLSWVATQNDEQHAAACQLLLPRVGFVQQLSSLNLQLPEAWLPRLVNQQLQQFASPFMLAIES